MQPLFEEQTLQYCSGYLNNAEVRLQMVVGKGIVVQANKEPKIQLRDTSEGLSRTEE